jgi:hypothetical protein
MGRQNEQDGEREQPELILVPYLFGQQEEDPAAEQQPGDKPPVMPAEAVPEGAGPDDKGQSDHTVFETRVVYDVDTQDRQAGEDQGQEGAMDGADY